MLTVVPDPAGRDSSASASLIDEIVREGARRMLAEALQAEVEAYIAQLAGDRDEEGRRLVVRNGYHKPREVITSAGAVEVTVPRVNAALPRSAHPGARKALAEIWGAEDKDHARAAVAAFDAAYGAKFPKAAAKIAGDLDQLLAFYDYPAEHWAHLRTTNPIESTFATVRHRTKVTKGPGSRAAGLAMAFKLIQATQDRWRCVNAPHLVALVRSGATFDGGKLVERPGQDARPVAAWLSRAECRRT
jgi:transposase-like protein